MAIISREAVLANALVASANFLAEADLETFEAPVKGILLCAKVTDVTGSATFTPVLKTKLGASDYITLWTAATTLVASATTVYWLAPDAATLTGILEAVKVPIPARIYAGANVAGTGTGKLTLSVTYLF